MHSLLAIPLNRSILSDITSLLEVLKAIQYTVIRKEAMITEFLVVLFRQINHLLVSLVTPLQVRLEGSSTIDVNKGLLLSIIKAVIFLVKTTEYYTPARQIALSIMIEMIIANGSQTGIEK
jgi:hypothetical protein